jgi:hypothetical protein
LVLVEILHLRRHLPIFEFCRVFKKPSSFLPPLPSIYPGLTRTRSKPFYVELIIARAVGICRSSPTEERSA